ncbi:hypothetical protein A9Q84_04485 [Halobacteriovorax marinus]|uniref:Uncharacterized protein n=1 Tax=Halobacteriovorax marinus TaxID=97084 RepID=A0A1Y5FH68_9BACT|nr:hypothetical protein A9Q84_04485 [Halobacteriovorax marinus]
MFPDVSKIDRSPSSSNLNCKELISLVLDFNHSEKRALLESGLQKLSKSDKDNVLSAIDGLYYLPFSEVLPDLKKVVFEQAKISDMAFASKFTKTDNSSLLNKFFGRFKRQSQSGSDSYFDLNNLKLVKDHMESHTGDLNYQSLNDISGLLFEGNVSKPVKIRSEAASFESFVDDSELQALKDNPYLEIVSTQLDGKLHKVKYKTLENSSQSITQLAEKKMKWFVNQRSEIGDMSDPDNLDRYIKLLANTYSELSSLNLYGTKTDTILKEFFFNTALSKEGFPPSRVVTFGEVNVQTLDSLHEQVIDGIASTHRLYEDLILRAKLGLALEDSPEWFSPQLVRKVLLDLQIEGRKNTLVKELEAFVDPAQFTPWLKYHVKENPDVLVELDKAPVPTLKKLADDFEIWTRMKRQMFDHKKEGRQEIELPFIDNDFIKMFGKNTSSDKEAFDAKMKLWYNEKQIVWRGQAHLQGVISDGGIVNMFKDIHHMGVSNQSLGSWKNGMSSGDWKKVVEPQFKNFNDRLYKGNLVEMMTDHQNEGALYYKSIGLSTSKDEKVGKAFASGAMKRVKGEQVTYGSQYADEVQENITFRVLMGAKRARKDVDLNRLRRVESEFRSTFARQQEVTAIGAIDPDAVTIIKTLGYDTQKNKVITDFTFIRNPDNPNEILKFSGDMAVDDDFDMSRLVSRFTVQGGSN